jgi:hypothetical protein
MATVRTAIARMTTRMAIGTVTRMATVRTAIARMTTGTVATRMAEETVHKMAGTIGEETSIPRPILVNIVVLAHEGTESNLCSVSHPYDSITLLHLDSAELRTSLQQC